GRMASFVDLTERKQAQKLLGESKRHIQILSSKLLEAEEEARKMIGKDLHDTIGSGLTAIKYALEKYITDMEKEPVQERSTLQQVVSMVQNAISETKRICRSLRPTALDDLGIMITVDGFCREFQKIHSGIRVERDIEIEENEVPDPLKIQIYRILQEALNNVVKHSGANLVRISLKKKEGNIELLIQDNGMGFDQPKDPLEDTGSNGMGLDTMKERVERYGGAWKIISSRGGGTLIKCLWSFI
ncbi:MAG: sensor histidine kinase, partial [Thermodesulfobacteriota bacterium]|nr:sensor histidine kinase [Thermodesulfobacteriota bacterium]